MVGFSSGWIAAAATACHCFCCLRAMRGLSCPPQSSFSALLSTDWRPLGGDAFGAADGGGGAQPEQGCFVRSSTGPQQSTEMRSFRPSIGGSSTANGAGGLSSWGSNSPLVVGAYLSNSPIILDFPQPNIWRKCAALSCVRFSHSMLLPPFIHLWLSPAVMVENRVTCLVLPAPKLLASCSPGDCVHANLLKCKMLWQS